MNIPLVSSALGLALTLSGGGYWVGTELSAKADKEYVHIVELKQDYFADIQIESLRSQKARIEKQSVKSEDDKAHIRYLEEEIKRARDARQKR